jgi:hypothetical protein
MSNINTDNIDSNFPVQGQDNPSQGFRDNFSAIKTQLLVAKSELEYLSNSPVGVVTATSTVTGIVRIGSGISISGNATISLNLSTVTQNIIPGQDITYNLGSSTHRFKDLYLSSSTIYLGDSTISVGAGGGISFPVTRALGGGGPGIIGAGTYTVDYTQTPGSTLTLSAGWQYTNPAGPGGYITFDPSTYTLDGNTLTVTSSPGGIDYGRDPAGTWNLTETYTSTGDSFATTAAIAETLTLKPGAEPTSPSEGTLAVADPITWNPAGDGLPHLMIYLGGVWNVVTISPV